MTKKVLTEKELEEIFSGKKRPKKIFKPLMRVGAFLLLCAVFYTVLNYRTINLKTKYWYDVSYKNIPQQNQSLARSLDSKTIDASLVRKQIPLINDNSISIPSINVEAPIIWNIPNTPDKVGKNLQNGIIHLEGTARPGQAGNVFITGHSSNYPWSKGDYNNIFALLNKVVTGDLIQIKYNQQDYIYKVYASSVVKPDNISVMEQDDHQSILSLMTCTPIGTSLNRLVITAKQVYPDPKSNSSK